MPGGWKKAKLRGISRLLSSDHRSRAKADNDGEHPLAAQAAAAASPDPAADAAPKNRPRPRKPPRCLRASLSADGGAVFSTMATLASQVIAATTRPPTPLASPVGGVAGAEQQQVRSRPAAGAWSRENEVPEDGLRSPPARSPKVFDAWSLPAPPRAAARGARSWKGEELESLMGAEALAEETLQGLPESKVPRKEVCDTFEASARVPETPGAEEQRRGLAFEASSGAEEPEKEAPDGGGSRGLLVLAKVLVFLVILVIGTKKIALGISISALAALFIEAIGKRLILVLRPCKEAEKSLVGADPVPRPCKEAEESLDGADDGGVSVSGLVQLPDGSDSASSEQISMELSEIFQPDSGSERSWEVKATLEGVLPMVRAPAPATLEEKEHVGDQRPRRTSGKTKKLLRKFVRRSSGASSVEGEER